ncbi:tetratricopeptide repeat protein [Rariglobus hedericola]|uniref:Tetratricopeptide repeat protein n=1 Tax=Rariglobus hedericola TaxID=2597822 RepID=A0A556QNJ1_9BACT|nr:tetratricopeptide repeat protein [Rariglobus hedericola]TSJ78211.1 tetratricopeptide repeat protein [Rariglobus hedericola]
MPEIPVSSLDPRVQKQIENSQIALQRGNLDYVLDVTTQVLKAAPGCLPVRRLQRVAQLRQLGTKNKLFAKAFGSVTQAGFMFGGGKKDPSKALENAEKMLSADPTSVPALKLLAEAAHGLDMPDTVAFAWEAIHELHPTDREALLNFGEACLLAKRPKDALRAADELLKLKPQDGDALALMRKSAIAQTTEKGNWEDKGSFRDKLKDEAASTMLEQSAKIVTSDEMTQKLIDEALVRIQSQPDSLNHYRSAAEGYKKLGNLEQALVYVRKARELPAGAGDTSLGKQESELKTAILEKRIKDLETQSALAPENAEFKQGLIKAKSEFAATQLVEAKDYVERYPNDYAARYTLGNLYFEAGDYQNAIANYQQAQKSPKVRVQAITGMGRSLKARKMFDLAVAQFQTAKSELQGMDDQKKDVIYELASCYEGMGKKEEAINEYKIIYSEDIGFRDVADKINAFYSS